MGSATGLSAARATPFSDGATTPRLRRSAARWQGRFGAAFLPATAWTVWCEADSAIRSLFGHLLAATTDDAVTLHDAAMRECVLDSSTPLPPTLAVFYWLHPYEEMKVYRTLAMHTRRGQLGSSDIFEIMKFFPLGFAVADLRSTRVSRDSTFCSQTGHFGSRRRSPRASRPRPTFRSAQKA